MASAGGAGTGAGVPGPHGMTTVEAAKQYIDRMIAEHSGMKVLLLDEETVSASLDRSSLFF